MADNGSVGAISLDLVIKNKIGKQLESMERTAETSAAKVGAAIENAISAPMEKAGKAVGKAVSEAVKNADIAVGDNVSAAINRALQRMEEQEQALHDAANAVPRAVSTGNYVNYDTSNVMAEVEEMSEKLHQKVAETVDKANEKLADIGKFKVDAEPTARLRQEIQLVTEQLNILQKKWQELSSADPTDKTVSQLNTTEQRIISTQNKLDGLKNKLYELEGTSKKTESSFKKAFSAIRSKASSAFGKIKSVGGKALSSLRSHFGSVGKSATSLLKPISKLGTALKNTFKRVFLMAGIYAAFRAVKDGLLEAAKADEQFSKSLNAVKANLSIAFTPILQQIMPALNALMSGLATVTRSVAGFIAGLFGSTYKQAAEATKKLKSTADTAKKTKVSMAGIDEMNVLSGGGDEDSSSSGSSSESEGIDYSNIDMSEPELPDWAERLKESIKSGGWSGVGSILAERVNSVFGKIDWSKVSSKINSGIGKVTDGINGFLDNIDWKVLGDTVAGGLNTITSAINTFWGGIKWDKLGKGIADGLNRAIKKTDWKGLGKALSAKIKAFIDAGFAFVTNFDFKGLGSGIGEAINSWFDNIDFGKAGTTISEGIKGVLDALITAVQTVDWSSIGTKIAEFIAAIDWGGIASRVFELLGSALGGAVSMLWSALQGVITAIKDYFSGKIDEAGGNVILGLLNGIIDGLKNIGEWIYEHIFKPFIDGFKKAFGIASPSKEMGEMGGFIIDGLFNAISDGIKKIKEIFLTMLSAILEIFANIDQWFDDKFKEAWERIKKIWSAVGDFFKNIWNGIKDVFSSVGNWFKDRFTESYQNVQAIWNKAKEFFSGIWNGIKEVFSAVGDWFKEQFVKGYERSQEAWNKAKEFFSGIWDGIKNVFSNVGGWFKDKFNDAVSKIKNVFSGIGDFFSGIWDKITGIFSDIGTKIGDAFSGTFKEAVNTIFEWIEEKINGFFDIINGAIGLINEIPGVEISKLDHIELPRLAKGGLATAPTLAMVGDNRNAKADPEVIAPLSKLQGMLGSGNDGEIVELLKIIIELLRGGMNIEIINYLFRNSKEFSREVLKAVYNDSARRGG
mgnify:CR=1 FL=1